MEQRHTPWSYDPQESIYTDSTNTSPFSSNISSYFRRPASRVMKSTSRHTSPRNSSRRRTTGSSTISRTRSVYDRQRTNMLRPDSLSYQSRPLSWHPNSQPNLETAYQDHYQQPIYQNPYPLDQFTESTAAYGLFTPVTHPVADEPQIQELISPLEELSAQEPTLIYHDSGYSYATWPQPNFSKQQDYTMDAMFPLSQQPVPQIWHWNHQTSMLDVPTAPPSPAFLPIQGGVEASPLALNTQTSSRKEDDGEELIGMGLYDSPADIKSSSLLFGGVFGGMPQKKHLKLEESFEPASESKEDDEADQEIEDDEDETENACNDGQQFHAKESFLEIEPENLQQSSQFLAGPSTLAGQSFYFGNEYDAKSADYVGMNYPVTGRYGYQNAYQMYNWA